MARYMLPGCGYKIVKDGMEYPVLGFLFVDPKDVREKPHITVLTELGYTEGQLIKPTITGSVGDG